MFAVTTIFSVFAYIWLYLCLAEKPGKEKKGIVTPTEAWLTFSYFWMLILIAYIADKANAKRMKMRAEARFGKEATASQIEHANDAEGKYTTIYTPLEFYNVLLPYEMGQKKLTPEEQKKAQEMKEFLKKEF